MCVHVWPDRGRGRDRPCTAAQSPSQSSGAAGRTLSTRFPAPHVKLPQHRASKSPFHDMLELSRASHSMRVAREPHTLRQYRTSHSSTRSPTAPDTMSVPSGVARADLVDYVEACCCALQRVQSLGVPHARKSVPQIA
eukprot:2701381-Rhodomonas_salina.1